MRYWPQNWRGRSVIWRARGTSTGTGASSTSQSTVQITIGSAAVKTITVRANPSTVSPSGGQVELTANVVGDNGIGLPQDRERIVEPYVTTRDKGTGLGLAITKKIVDEHGGIITAENVDSGGARVTVLLPLDEKARELLAAAGREGRGTELRRDWT